MSREILNDFHKIRSKLMHQTFKIESKHDPTLKTYLGHSNSNVYADI